MMKSMFSGFLLLGLLLAACSQEPDGKDYLPYDYTLNSVYDAAPEF